MKIVVSKLEGKGNADGESRGNERRRDNGKTWIRNGNNDGNGGGNYYRGNGGNNYRKGGGGRHRKYRTFSKYTTMLELELHNDLLEELSRIGKERGHTLFKQIREFLEDSVTAYNGEMGESNIPIADATEKDGEVFSPDSEGDKEGDA